MTDWNEATSTTGTVEDSIMGAAERGIEHVKAIAADFVEAGRSAALSVLDEQKADAARQVAAIAGAVRSAAHSLAQGRIPVMARYTEEAAGSIERFGNRLRERSWGELFGDLDFMARSQPILFVTLSTGLGFLTGRLLWASGGRSAAMAGNALSQTTAVERESEAVTAAVSSAPGEEGLSEPAAGISGAPGPL